MRHSAISTLLIALVSATTAVTAWAGGDVTLHEVEYQNWSPATLGDPIPVGGPVIRVYSESGHRFDFVGHTNQPVRFYGLLSGACPRINKISVLEFKVEDSIASVSHPDGRGAWFSRYGTVAVPHDQLDDFDAVAACNNKLKTLAAETGRPQRELVAEGFGVRFPDWIEARGILHCTGRNNSDSDTERLDLWVECVGKPDAGPPHAPKLDVIPATLSPLITDLSFEVDRPNHVGQCPVGLMFTGSITTSRAGTVRYRTVANDGSTSPTYTLSFGSAGTKAISKWGETLSKPDISGKLNSAPGGTGPDYTGWRRLEIVEPSGFAPSPPADYSVTCSQKTMQLQAVPVAPTKAPSRIKKD
jgi:hypothetical protein